MAGAKNHDYHILPPEHLAAHRRDLGAGLHHRHGAVHARHAACAGWCSSLGVAGVLATIFSWWSNVIKEAHAGDHTPVVQLHLRYGMILFIASEVMFFVGWFWAWFDFSLFPDRAGRVSIGGQSGRPRASRCSTRSACRCSTR